MRKYGCDLIKTDYFWIYFCDDGSFCDFLFLSYFWFFWKYQKITKTTNYEKIQKHHQNHSNSKGFMYILFVMLMKKMFWGTFWSFSSQLKICNCSFRYFRFSAIASDKSSICIVQKWIIYLTLLLMISNACWRAKACQIITFLMKIMDFGWKFLCFLTKTPNPNLVTKKQNPEPWCGVTKPKPQTLKSCQKT